MGFEWTDERLEREVEGPCVKYAIGTGWLEIKIERSNKRGWPDRLFIRAGRHVFVEFKRPDKEATRQQQKRHKELRDHGAEVYLIDNLEDFVVLFA